MRNDDTESTTNVDQSSLNWYERTQQALERATKEFPGEFIAFDLETQHVRVHDPSIERLIAKTRKLESSLLVISGPKSVNYIFALHIGPRERPRNESEPGEWSQAEALHAMK